MEKRTLIMPFEDESESFTNGFECGQIWEKMTNCVVFQDQIVHACNKLQIQLMCDHFGYHGKFVDAGEEWTAFTGAPVDISSISE
jgi:hypothetical protein